MPPADPQAEIADGRLRKGERRRRLLLDATLRVVARDGVAAVTQRAVAAEAELPPSAVMYYFATVDDLLVAALTAVNDRYLDALLGLPQDPEQALTALAELVAGCAGQERGLAIAENELWLLAARRPGLHGELLRWSDALDALAARFTADPVARAAAAAGIDGLFLQGVTRAEPLDAAATRAVLERLLAR